MSNCFSDFMSNLLLHDNVGSQLLRLCILCITGCGNASSCWICESGCFPNNKPPTSWNPHIFAADHEQASRFDREKMRFGH
jgi:hypothetical protein